tara:strand:- start:1774 stop:2631 length:858 start_codon:yes stop_codon:yes gene_type:complete
VAKNIKHSKIKNTGVMFELLVRQITSDTLNGMEKSPALKIVKEYFKRGKTLKKELDLYNSLLKEKFANESKAERFLDMVLAERSKLSSSTLRRQKYNLIKEIGRSYSLETFFKTKIGNYKLNASIYQLFENTSSKDVKNPRMILNSRETIVEHVTAASPKTTQERMIKEYSKQDKSMRLLSYKVLLEKFNEKYGKELNAGQKLLLKKYISGQTDKLVEHLNSEALKSRKKITTFANKIDDRITSIKLNEVSNQLTRIEKANNTTDSYMTTMMNVYELLEELKNVN